jgi:hypothetical protein
MEKEADKDKYSLSGVQRDEQVRIQEKASTGHSPSRGHRGRNKSRHRQKTSEWRHPQTRGGRRVVRTQTES